MNRRFLAGFCLVKSSFRSLRIDIAVSRWSNSSMVSAHTYFPIKSEKHGAQKIQIREWGKWWCQRNLVSLLLKTNCTWFSKICEYETTKRGFILHLRRYYELTDDFYERLATCETELQNFKHFNGFTDIYGQCGFCLKLFSSLANLKRHKLTLHGEKGATGKATAATIERSERKGVSMR